MSFTSILEIKPKQGLSKLNFGATMVEAEKYFGKPEAVENIDDIEDYKSIVWHYWQQGFSLFFDDSHHNTFSCVELDESDCVLWGEPIFKLNEKKIIELFNDNNFTDIDAEDHEWGEKRISFDDAVVDLYFEKGKLMSVNYCAPHSDKKVLIFPN
jgi:hypothetical protein